MLHIITSSEACRKNKMYEYSYEDLYVWDSPIDSIEENKEDEPELYEAIQIYKEKTEIELIEARSAMRSSDLPKEQKNTHLKAIRLVFCAKLKVVPHQEVKYMIEVLKSSFKDVYKEIEAIKKFKDHRHKTIHGLYTEKAVY